MKTLKLIWKNKDLRNKLLIVIAILFGIRILSGIPTPGVNRNYFKLLLAQNSTLNFFNAISGNGLSNLSIMALSIAVTMQVYNHALFERKQSEVARIPSALAV